MSEDQPRYMEPGAVPANLVVPLYQKDADGEGCKTPVPNLYDVFHPEDLAILQNPDLHWGPVRLGG